ncbi:MAG: hypothetical protein HKN20_03385 [Gemmatimonadetes bacterium]|nr:hypothetical protein [Gemmatimonadota bacterium]
MAIPDAALIRLLRESPEEAWDQFLDEYTNLIFSVAAKFRRDEDGRVDLYLHICEKLHENGMRRLLKFDPDRTAGSCKLSTWLVTVSRNLCIDFIRGKQGRKRLNEPIKKLPEREQLVFKYCYWEGMSFAEAYETLRTRHGMETSFGEVHDAVRTINGVLTSHNLWNLAHDLMRMVPALSLDAPVSPDGEGRPLELPADAPGPDEEAAAREVEIAFRETLASLEPQSKLILKSYYMMQLSVKEIAETVQKPEHTIYRELKRVTGEIGKSLAAREITAGSMPPGFRMKWEAALS